MKKKALLKVKEAKKGNETEEERGQLQNATHSIFYSNTCPQIHLRNKNPKTPLINLSPPYIHTPGKCHQSFRDFYPASCSQESLHITIDGELEGS